MPKLVFSSDDLPPHLPNAVRVSAWRDQFAEKFGPAANPIPRSDVPFHASIEVVPLTGVTLGAFRGSLTNVDRTKAGIAADGSDHMNFVINNARAPYHMVQKGREVLVETGGAALFSEASACVFEAREGISTFAVRVERRALAGLMRTPEDLVAVQISAGSQPLRLLKSYVKTLMATGEVGDAGAARAVGNHLLDLVALSLGPTRDAGEAAQRGLRAGRLDAVLAAIHAGFLDPSFSIQAVAQHQRVSERYLRDLLHESGTGFADRVLEQRLQHAYRLLTHWQHGHRKVTDIAFTSGFNDVSYFNRSFRGRFGMTPSDARAAAAASGAGAAAGAVRAAIPIRT